MGIQPLADVRQVEYGLRLATIQCLVKLALNVRANQQRKLRVVGTQVNANAFRCTQPVQRQSHLYKRLNICHAHQTKTDALGALGINDVVLRVQCQCGV